MVLKYFKQKPPTEIRKVWFYVGYTYYYIKVTIYYIKVTIVERAAYGNKAKREKINSLTW